MDFKFGPLKSNFDPETCRAACKDYKFIALIDTGTCGCAESNQYGIPTNKYKKVDDGFCNANNKVGFGGITYNAVYENLKFR